MKILSKREQLKALREIKAIKTAIEGGNDAKILMSMDNLAELTYIIGGIKALKELGGAK